MENDVSRISYVSPLIRGYSSYVDHLVAFNRKIHDEVSQELPSYFEDFEGDIAITTTGSDARLEKGPVSLIEIMLFGKNAIEIQEAHRRLSEYMAHNDNVNLFDQYVEIKDISSDPISYYLGGISDRGNTKLTSPNRILDSRLFFSTDEILNPTREKFISETRSSEGKSILKDIKEKYREHRETSLTGIQDYKRKKLKHFDLEAGISFYNPEEHIWSFKQGPLRMVQYAIVRDVLKRIRDGTINEDVFFLPKNTVKKLHTLEVDGRTNVSHGQIEDLSDCYKYFLHQYHLAQFVYRNNGTNEFGFDVGEVKERIDCLEKICSSTIIN